MDGTMQRESARDIHIRVHAEKYDRVMFSVSKYVGTSINRTGTTHRSSSSSSVVHAGLSIKFFW